MRDWVSTKRQRLAASVTPTEIAKSGPVHSPAKSGRPEAVHGKTAIGHDIGQIRVYPVDLVGQSVEPPLQWSAEPLGESVSGKTDPATPSSSIATQLATASTRYGDRDAKRDDEDEEQASAQSGSSEAEAANASQSEEAGAETAESGQSEEAGTVEPIEGEPVIHCGAEEQQEEDSSAADQADATGANGSSPIRLGVRARLSVVGETGQGQPASGHKHSDAVKGSLTSGSSVTKGGVTMAATSFGEEAAKFSIDGITYKVGKAAVDVAGRMFVDCKWDIQSRGRTDVSDAAGASVTDGTWKAVETDLTADAKGIPTRKTYWASDLTSRHEKFHASDDIGRAALYRPTAETWLSKQTVDPKNAKSEVADLMEKARDMLKADNWAWYNAGGEDRAYADGKASYDARVKDVKDRATKEKWK